MNFSGSRALSEGLEILKSRFGVLIATALIFYVAMFAVMAVFGGSLMQVAMMGAGGGDPGQAMAGMGLSLLLFYVLLYAVQFAMTLALMRLCSDRHAPSIGDAIGAGVRGVPTLFGAAILIGIVGLVVGLILGAIVGIIVATANSSAISLIVGLGFAVGAIYLFARMSMLVPVIAIDEERNPITAISRSWRMTDGAALKIALVYGAAIVAIIVLMFLMAGLTIGVGAMGGGAPNPAGIIGFVIGMVVVGLTVGLYMQTLVAAIHRQLSDKSVETATKTFS